MSVSEWVPEQITFASLKAGVEACQGCELHADAEHGVAGEGAHGARLMLVGEQPGDKEDQAGRPFVGPAGALLVEALDAAGIDRGDVYRTNAVKHFRWSERRGKQRIHKTPGRTHVVACAPWLDAEVDLVRPTGVVLLGATAGQAVLGTSFRVGAARGTAIDWPSDAGTEHVPDWVVPTVHPASVLRSRERDADLQSFVADLRVAAGLLRIRAAD